jgi:EAL domain-containing protein (putative c-di-GMP-specific phosphodiesterase class I)
MRILRCITPRRAVAQAWQDIGLAPIRIAVNISAVELRSKDFSKGIDAILGETGLDPELLELELTETFLVQDSTATLSVLRDLKQLGLNLALSPSMPCTRLNLLLGRVGVLRIGEPKRRPPMRR